jgi:hypothetical protein
MPNLMKNLSVRAELFHADGQTNMMKLIVDVRNYAQVSSKG